MVLQCAALFAIFVSLQWFEWLFLTARDTLIYAMLGATILSGLQYIWRAFLLVKLEDWRL